MDSSSPRALRFVLVAAALALGVLGQALVSSDNLRWALAPYVIGVAAIALAASSRPLSSFDAGRRDPEPDATGHPVAPAVPVPSGAQQQERRLGLYGVALSLAMLGGALYLFAAGPPNTLAWYLYGASVVLLLLSLPTFEGRWTALWRRLRDGAESSFELRGTLPWAGLAAVLALGLGLRLYHLQELPAGLWYDEAVSLVEARAIRIDPGATPVFSPPTNLPTLFLMPIAVVIDMAGFTPTAGRLVAVAFGLGGVVAVYLLVRLMMGPHLALVAAFLITVMRWDINWSRIGLPVITAPLFTALAVYLTLRALRSGRRSDFGYAGAAIGLGLWFYSSNRIFPLAIGVIVVHHLLFRRPERAWFLGRLLVMAGVGLAVVAPVLQSAVTDRDEFFARQREVAVFTHFSFDDGVREIVKSLGKHVLMFNHEGDENGRHNLPRAPMLDFFSSILLVLGLGIALARWRDGALLGLPFWVLIMLVPGFMTLPWEAPQSLRSIGVIPAVVVLMTLAVGVAWSAGRSAPWRTVRLGTPPVLALLLGLIAFLNINTYFGEQAHNPEVFASFSTDETLMATHMVQARRDGYSLMISRQFLHGLTIALLADQPRLEVIRAPAEVPIHPDRVWLGASIYLEPREASVYRLLQSYYPDGRFEEVRPPGGGEVLYYSAVISREELERNQGLSAQYRLPDGTIREVPRRPGEQAWSLDSRPDGGPVDLAWEGSLHVVEPGEYVLELEGEPGAELLLDGRLILGRERTSVRIEPAVGLHSLLVRGSLVDRGSTLRLLWQPPGERLGPVPLSNLYHGSVRPVGLAGRFYRERLELDVADATRVTPAMDTFYYDPVLPEPYLASWSGALDVPVGGPYRFSVGGAGTVRLFVDGQQRAESPPSGSADPEGTVLLGAGTHSILVAYLSLFPPSQLEVLWAPPGSTLKPIPIERLSPDPEHMFRILAEGE